MNHEKHERHERILFRKECYAIQGVVFEVYRKWGPVSSRRSIRSAWNKN
jgi:hypothetical protein